jgi:hypothetical protein
MRGSFHIPTQKELVAMGAEERLNVFRRFFASSRYSRLIIQQILVKSAIERALSKKVASLESAHNAEFEEVLKTVKEYGFLQEFLTAVREEDVALQKIIEAYDRRMEGRV